MTRRNLLFGLFAGATIAAADDQIEVINASPTVIKTWNEFAITTKEWIALRKEAPAGSVSWPALRQWQKKVKPAFHTVDVAVKNE